MIQALTIIIAACSIHTGNVGARDIDYVQKTCQKELITCLAKSKGKNLAVELAWCIKERQ